jgi:hypothetical protein
MLDNCLSKLPSRIEIDQYIVSHESVESIVLKEIRLLNDNIQTIFRSLTFIKQQLTSGMILNKDSERILHKLESNCLPE